MHFFIDESGTFTHRTDADALISTVGILVVPSTNMVRFERLFRRHRQNLPKLRGEVKGKTLTERQVSSTIDVLRKTGCLFFSSAIDLSLHSLEELESHRSGQAKGITIHLSKKHHPRMIEDLWKLRHQVEIMSMPQYVQLATLNDAIVRTLNLSTNYFAFHRPRELSEYHWAIDGKNKQKATNWEIFWHKTVMPMIQSRSLRSESFFKIEGGNYSFQKHLESELPKYLKAHAQKQSRGEAVLLRPIFTEDLRFSSEPEPGLEAVDILTNGIRRALVGNLRKSGWGPLPSLMVDWGRGECCIGLPHLGRNAVEIDHQKYSSVLRHFMIGGRKFLPANYFSKHSDAN
ncbi:hypothetical protein [Nisaea sp.]|uniref:hypothetical protein n=1 Tax=Nisaea sp. TaxID=2024842 RepID=UPI0032EE3D78